MPKKIPKAFWCPLAVSCLVHGWVMLLPAWQLPERLPPEEKLLSAVLLQVPTAPPVGAVQAKTPKRAPPAPKQANPPLADAPTAQLGPKPLPSPELPSPSAPLAASVPAALAQASAVSAEPLGQSAPQAEAPVLAALSEWPQQGRIRYQSSYMGVAIQGDFIWSRDDTQFQSELIGSIPLRGELLHQTSTGRVVDGRPISDRFHEAFNKAEFVTLFDGVEGKLRQTRKGEPREVPTAGYALDMLALTHLMALQPRETPNFDIFVVTFRGSVSRVTVRQYEAQGLELPAGVVQARRFHAERADGKIRMDIWLATQWRNAPVRIRVETSDGTYDLKAEEVEIDHQVLGKMVLRSDD